MRGEKPPMTTHPSLFASAAPSGSSGGDERVGERRSRKRPALRDRPELIKITIYIDRTVYAMIESASINRQLMTGDGAHIHTKSALIGEVLANEFVPSYQKYGDYFPTIEQLLATGWLPPDPQDPIVNEWQARQAGRSILPPSYLGEQPDAPPRQTVRRGAKKREG